MADENSDVTEIVDAAVGYEPDEGDEDVSENTVAAKKMKGSEWKTIRSSNEIHSKLFCDFVIGRKKTDKRMCTNCSQVVISVNYGTSSMWTHWNACKDRQSGKGKQCRIQLPQVPNPAVSVKQKGIDKVAQEQFKVFFIIFS